MDNLKSQRGFTLPELLIGMILLIIILAAILGVMPASIRAQMYNFEEGANIQDTRVVLNAISNELCNATQITLPGVTSSENSITYRHEGDSMDRTISLGTTSSEKGYVLIAAPDGSVKKIGSGRIKSVSFLHKYVSDASESPCKRDISVSVQVQAKTDAPLSDITTNVVTLNAF